jgi:hypothetical protein
LTAKVSTLGAGGDLTVGLGRYFDVRACGQWMEFEPGMQFEDIDIGGKLRWLTFGGLADVFPFARGFRLTGGALVNRNRYTVETDVETEITVNGHDYEITEFDGTVSFPILAPYVGIGWGKAAGRDKRWHFACDLGVLYQGEPRVRAEATAKYGSQQNALDRDLDRDMEAVEDDVSSYGGFYPVISLGVSFRF